VGGRLGSNVRHRTWVLIGLFTLFPPAHLVLTVLFVIGVWDTGVGYVLNYKWPAWLITLIDGVAASLLWSGYRRGASRPWRGLALTSVAAVLMLARASWMMVVPVAVTLTIAGSIGRILRSRRPAITHAEPAAPTTERPGAR
jgi:hypothetical protein